jgi:electron transfer flavoprotein alpha subunit
LQVLTADHAGLEHAVAEPLTEVLLWLQNKHKFDYIIAPHSTFGKNVLPRVAALLDVAPISDVVQIVDKKTFVR